MTVACFSPSLMTCEYSDNAVTSLHEKIEDWITDLREKNIEYLFTDDYVKKIFSQDWPWNDSSVNRNLLDLRRLIARGSIPSQSSGDAYCSCSYSNDAWNDLLYTIKERGLRFGIIAQCDNSDIHGIPICNCIRDFLLIEYPWLKEIDDRHRDIIPVRGVEISYIPPENWINGIKQYWPEIDKNGYIDVNNSLWVWQDEEGGHWDVTTKTSTYYTRVGRTGKIIDSKCRL